MPPFIPAIWSVTAFAALFFSSLRSLCIFSVGLVFLIIISHRSTKPLTTAIKWSLPFVLPLIIVHGIINPTFPVAYQLGNLLPIRTDGILYALSISNKIFFLTAIVITWRSVESEKLMADARKLGVPDNLVITIAISSAIVHTISTRIKAVYIAQQARGIGAGPGFIARISALPAVILPVITSTLIEAHARGTLMTNRGLGTSRILFPGAMEKCSYRDVALACSILLFFGGAYLLK